MSHQLRSGTNQDPRGNNGYGTIPTSSSYEPTNPMQSRTSPRDRVGSYTREGYRELDGNLTDDGYYQSENDERNYSPDDFEKRPNIDNRVTRTGRQRKKLAARTKGGEFQAKRRKRRVFFCCLCSEIDIQKLHEHFLSTINADNSTWKTRIYGEALCLSKPGATIADLNAPGISTIGEKSTHEELKHDIDEVPLTRSQSDMDIPKAPIEEDATLIAEKRAAKLADLSMKISDPGNQELFVFEFGAVVFWGFPRGEETHLLDVIRGFATKGLVEPDEFESGKDDMAFVTYPDVETISIANDVITFPEETTAKQRLAVSFAIAQSTVLAIFEARIENRVTEYKYIPETLAQRGKIHLSSRLIGTMIGEIFVIRHDLNLHTDILDTPDFFWEEDKYEPEYKMVTRYLEMSGRVEVLNKRLDILRELLDVLQQQMENAHATKLEWIVIWLIVMEVVIEIASGLGGLMGLWSA